LAEPVTRLLQWLCDIDMSRLLYRPFRKRLAAFTKQLDGIDKGKVEALHHARVASRRLREVLPLLELDRDVTRPLMRRLRKVTKQLGTVRELDALLLLIQELTENSRHSVMALKLLRSQARQARAAAQHRLRKKLPPAKLERLIGKLERISKSFDSDVDDSDRRDENDQKHAPQPGARLARRATAVQRAIEAAGVVYLPEHLHGVRITVKKLRYAAELSAEVTHTPVAADIAVLKRVQDLLGRLHDFDVLIVRAREAQASLSPPDLRTWRELGALVHILEDVCRRLHARWMRDRTKVIAIANRAGAAPGESPLTTRAAG
jgi:CHAD domain-containing protein